MEKSIKIKNTEIIPTFEFLQDLELLAKASRGRNRLQARLAEKNKEFANDLMDIQKEYFKTNDDGDLITEDGKNLVPIEGSDLQEFNDKVYELNDESAEIIFGEDSDKLEALFAALDDLQTPLSGQKALIYDMLMTAYEEQ
jgi:hypothetical protein